MEEQAESFRGWPTGGSSRTQDDNRECAPRAMEKWEFCLLWWYHGTVFTELAASYPRPNCSRSALCPPAQAGREERVRIAESNVWCG